MDFCNFAMSLRARERFPCWRVFLLRIYWYSWGTVISHERADRCDVKVHDAWLPALIELDWFERCSFVTHETLFDYTTTTQQSGLGSTMKVMQMLEEGVLGCVELLVTGTIAMIVLCMLNVNCSISSPAKVTVVCFRRGKVRAEWRSCILGGDIIEAAQEPATPNTTMGVLIHLLDVCKDFLTIPATKRLIW